MNKMLDRIAATMIAFGGGIVAYGTVQEVLRQRGPGEPPARMDVAVWSAAVGVALIVLALAVGYIFQQRED